jgi:hypothetical protein
VSFSVWPILAGVFWVAFGCRGIEQFYLMNEIVKLQSRIIPRVRENRIGRRDWTADEIDDSMRRGPIQAWLDGNTLKISAMN